MPCHSHLPFPIRFILFQLYFRRDNPIQFSIFARPSNVPNNQPIPTQSLLSTASALSTLSYAPSSVSFSFTLCSNTDTSSTGSALFEKKEPGSDAFAGQLKRIYQNITALEGKIGNEDGMGSHLQRL
jgi:protein SMG6